MNLPHGDIEEEEADREDADALADLFPVREQDKEESGYEEDEDESEELRRQGESEAHAEEEARGEEEIFPCSPTQSEEEEENRETDEEHQRPLEHCSADMYDERVVEDVEEGEQ